MKDHAMILVCSGDDALADRLVGIVEGLAEAHRAREAAGAARLLDRFPFEAALVDLRQPDAPDLLTDLRRQWPALPIIVLGQARSAPRLEAERLGVFAADDPDAAPEHLRRLVSLAVEQRRLAADLEEALEAGRRPTEERHAPAGSVPVWGEDGPSLARALRSIERPEAVWENALDWIASTARVSRAGIFAAEHRGAYRLRAGLRCMEETTALEFDRGDPLVRWMEVRLHLVARSYLERLGSPAERRMLQQALDAMGAEILAPLHMRGRLLGWVFTGPRATGIPFEASDLERFVVLVEQVSRVIENTLLYEEAILQKTTAETLLEAIPTGIVSAGPDGCVWGCNAAAERILDRPTAEVQGRPVEALGSRLGSLLRHALEGKPVDEQPWAHPAGHALLLSSRRLEHAGLCLGAIALITDVTARQEMENREQRLERSRFWTELAAGMSHEIRNPLVAIKTFAQLLPERYMDEDFRRECSTLLSSEADRLNAIVEQITAFASPPALSMHPVPVEPLIRRVLKACAADPSLPPLRCDIEIEDPLPPILGDERALTEAVTHILRNAAEALAGRKDGVACLCARHLANRPRPVTEISVQDNGPGLPAEVRHRPFSPFTTTKARGMGLGLAIVQRTAMDHGGDCEIDTSERGTRVALLLPAPDTHALRRRRQDE